MQHPGHRLERSASRLQNKHEFGLLSFWGILSDVCTSCAQRGGNNSLLWKDIIYSHLFAAPDVKIRVLSEYYRRTSVHSTLYSQSGIQEEHFWSPFGT
jgi:hypothetical protein